MSLVIPLDREEATFRSIIGHIDGRYDLHSDVHEKNDSLPVKPLPGLDVCPVNLSIMASKLSYETAAFIRDVVNNKWKVLIVVNFTAILL